MRNRPRSGANTAPRHPARRQVGHPVPRPVARPVACSVDLACITADRRDLVVLLLPGGKGAWRLPGAPWRIGASLDDAAGVLARSVFGRDPVWREQVGASATGAHPDRAPLSVTFTALLARGTPAAAVAEAAAWHDVGKLPAGLAPRHRSAVAAAVAHLRGRMDHVPIAFRLLPNEFTLTDLQQVYELLLGRRLHKASFRRALQAAYLVEPTDEWRGEGRGRPAQLFRYAPKRRRGVRRTMRFELLG